MMEERAGSNEPALSLIWAGCNRIGAIEAGTYI